MTRNDVDIQGMYNRFKAIRDSEPGYYSAYNRDYEYYTYLMTWCKEKGAVDEQEG